MTSSFMKVQVTTHYIQTKEHSYVQLLATICYINIYENVNYPFS